MKSAMSCCSSFGKNKAVGLLLLRLAVGIIFLIHGYGKLFGNMPSMTMFTGMVTHLGFPFPAFFAWIAALAEFLGGIALILGVWTKCVTPFLAIDMLVAFGAVMNLDLNRGGLEFLLLMTSIALFFTGPGKMSLGYKLKMKKMGKDGKTCGCGGSCSCGDNGCGGSSCGSESACACGDKGCGCK
jgi:putative oxidoreductase